MITQPRCTPRNVTGSTHSDGLELSYTFGMGTQAPATDTGDDVAFAPMHVLATRLKAGELTAAKLVDCYLQRIQRYDDKYHAFVEVYADEACKAAAAADRALKAGNASGPLHGIPIALKDLIDVAGKRTTGGSLYWRERISPATATVAQRLTDAGMITLGKTHMVEFAFGAWGTNQTMGTPWNPWDLETPRTPGGSSSGSGVAVAAGLAPAAIGSDTGGSVRIPASLCGIVGLKTTVGRVSNYGTLRLSETLDTLGPMTRDVEDAALLFNAIHGFDPRDAETLPHAQIDALKELKSGIQGMRLAVLPGAALGELDPAVTNAFAQALDVLRDLGARIETIQLPHAYLRLAEIVGKIISAEGYALHREWIDRDDLPFDHDVRNRIRWAKGLSAADYIHVMAERKTMQRDADAMLRDYSALLMPTTPLPAIPLSDVDQGKAPMSLLTRPINLLDMCALAVPCGFTGGGLPVSLQICGRGYKEASVLRIGWAYENATEWHRRRPPAP
jgi:aspartyl-tRNA(Asn)/glutamyl-tRNA(Gln) amidotransferase subunit A